MAQTAETIRKLPARDLKLSSTARPDYRVVITDNTTTPDDVTNPQYWAHVAETFTNDRWKFAVVELIWSDASRYMRLLVVDAGKLYAKVRVLENIQLEASESKADPEPEAQKSNEYIVKFRGPHHKHSVVRVRDNFVVEHGFATKEDAESALAAHLKAIG